MDTIMKHLQIVLLVMALFVIPGMPSLVLCGLSLISFKRHDWSKGFFHDKWGAVGILSFLSGVVIFVVGVYLPTGE